MIKNFQIKWLKQIFAYALPMVAILASEGVRANKLAIVIDDVGYRQKEDAEVYAMPTEISVAIISSAPYAKQRNQLAQEQGRDILIHMPMETLSKQRLDPGGLTIGMPADEVERRVHKAQSIVSYAIGMNNHMGSAATADRPLMENLMKVLQEQDLYFLDSRTSPKSVAAKIAKEYGVGSLTRDIFLDNSDLYEDVEKQFQTAIAHARKYGVAIVIGHPRKNTIAVLQQGLKTLPEDIQLVGMGSLWLNNLISSPKSYPKLFNNSPAPTSVAPFTQIPLMRGVPY